MPTRFLKRPAAQGAGRSDPDPAVSARVSEILGEIDRHGIDAVRRYRPSSTAWNPAGGFDVTAAEIEGASAELTESLRASIAFAQEQIRGFAELQRATVTDFEAETLPGVFIGQRQVPVSAVGSYCPL